ncbi:hypothetical protein Fmac_004140 [Flemingia macrophylla]|uniref:Uncharacterized protein n=1 Tax=Flemingia macrophylla TaxID=520843 RepID=A0ABD1N427_9FABA
MAMINGLREESEAYQRKEEEMCNENARRKKCLVGFGGGVNNENIRLDPVDGVDVVEVHVNGCGVGELKVVVRDLAVVGDLYGVKAYNDEGEGEVVGGTTDEGSEGGLMPKKRENGWWQCVGWHRCPRTKPLRRA